MTSARDTHIRRLNERSFDFLWSLLGLVALIAFFTACSPQESSSGSGAAPTTTKGETPHPWSVQTEELKLPKLECASNEACPDAIGELVTITSTGVKYCTASLVSNDTVLTASHCVPWENVGGDASITGGCWVRWPGSKDITPCATLVEASALSGENEGVVQADYAFIKIRTPSERKPLGIHPSTPGQPERRIDTTRIVLFGVAPEQTPHLIQRHECARNNSFPLSLKKAQPGQTIIMPGCPAVVGHSGGPILDVPMAAGETNEILGVLSLIEFRNPSANKKSATVAVGTRVAQPEKR